MEKILEIGKKINLKNPLKQEVYQSVIEEYDEDKTFSIGIPYGEDGILTLNENELWEMNVVGDNEQYFFTSQVLGRKKETVPLYIFSFPKEIRRVQLRSFVRIDLTLDVYYEVITEDTERQNLKWFNPENKAISIDLGGGGMRLVVKEDIPKGSLLVLRFELRRNGEADVVMTMARVKRTQIVQSRGSKLFQLGVEFEDIPEGKRDTIIGFVFQKMLERRSLAKDI